MSTKITVIYDNSVNPAVFEEGYPAQVVLAKSLPGLQRVESAKVWPKEDGTPTPAYRTIDLYFDDYDAASEAVTTQEADAFFPNIFELATGGVRILFSGGRRRKRRAPPGGRGRGNCGRTIAVPVNCLE